METIRRNTEPAFDEDSLLFLLQSKSQLPLKLMDLNEYCLLEILKYLNFTDLLVLSDVNERFRGLVSRQLPLITFNFCELLKFTPAPSILSIALLEKIFQQFGHLITKLKLNAEHFVTTSPFYIDVNRKLLRLIGKYCANGKLRELSLIKFHILHDELVHRQRSIFHNLNKLSLNDCTMENKECMKMIMNNCWKLKILKLSDFRSINDIQHIPFSNLDTLILKNCGRYFEMIPYEILRNQMQLKCFRHVKRLSDPMRIPYEFFIKFMPNVESLSLNWFNRRYTDLLNLPNLRHLQITVEEQSIYAFNEFCAELAVTNKLETLHVKILQFTFGCFIPGYRNLAKALCRFTNLRKLHLEGMSKVNPFLNYLADNLTNLQELHITWNESLETISLVAFVEKLPNLEGIYLLTTPMLNFHQLFNQLIIISHRRQRRRQQHKKRIIVYIADERVDLTQFKADLVCFVHFTGKFLSF